MESKSGVLSTIGMIGNDSQHSHHLLIPTFNFLSGNNPPMSFKHLRMLNSASKCPKITPKVNKF
jgi:hypothetical protein